MGVLGFHQIVAQVKGGRVDAAGYLHLLGRTADVIIRGGLKIFAGEVEHALRTHAAVDEAAVVGIASAKYGEAVAAVVSLNSPLSEERLRGHCRDRLPPHKVPSRIAVVERLPKSVTGKVRKADLARYLSSA